MPAFQGLKWVPEEVSFQVDRLYHYDSAANDFYELDKDTKLVIFIQTTTPASGIQGVGGASNKLFCIISANIYELDIDTLLSIRNVTPPGGSSQHNGIGGILNRLYSTGRFNTNIYELDTDTLLQISSVASSAGYGCGGIGSNRLYSCSTSTIYENDINTKLSISSVASPGADAQGIGGTVGRLYHCDKNSDLIYELDLNTKLQISSASGPSTNPVGIGGIKSDILTKVIIQKATFGGNTFNLSEIFLDTKPQ